MQGGQVLDHAIAYEVWKQHGGKEDDNLCLHSGMTQRSALFDLPYWKVWIKNHCFNIIMLFSIVAIVEFVHNENLNWPILLPLLKGYLLGLISLNLNPFHRCHCGHTSIGYSNIDTITKMLFS
jgi:hypothetical protein